MQAQFCRVSKNDLFVTAAVTGSYLKNSLSFGRDLKRNIFGEDSAHDPKSG